MVTYLSTRSAAHLVAVVAVWITVSVMCVAGLRWQHEWQPRAHVTGTVDSAVPAEEQGPDRARALFLMALTMFSLALTASLMIKVPDLLVPALVVVIAAPAVALVILAMVLRDVYRRRPERGDDEEWGVGPDEAARSGPTAGPGPSPCPCRLSRWPGRGNR